MTDCIWPLKNPYRQNDDWPERMTLRHALPDKHIGWERGHEDTMKALRPLLKNAGEYLVILDLIDQKENKGLGILIDKIEQILDGNDD